MLQKFAVNKDVFHNPLVSSALLQLRVLGYVYPENASYKILHFVRGIITAVMMYFLVACQMYALWLHHGEFSSALQTFGCAVTYINILTRIFLFYTYNKEYKLLINNIEIGTASILKTGLPVVNSIYNQYRKYIAVLTFLLCIFIVPSIVWIYYEAIMFLKFRYNDWVLSQISNWTISTNMPLLYTFYPIQNLGPSYYCTVVSPFFIILVGFITVTGMHSFNASLMRYISFRLDVLKYKIANIQEFVDLTLKELPLPVGCREDRNHIWRQVFRSCTHDYYDIVSFAKSYGKVSSGAVFFESFTTSILLCILLYMISMDASAGNGVHEIWCLLIIEIIWLYYWHGNQIITKSNEITTAIYFQKWYELPVSMQKDTLLFMTVTMKPIVLKAGFININNETLVKILKTSYSYLMLLRSWRD